MKRSKRIGLTLVCVLALLPIVGCSDDDDLLNVPVEEAVESGIDEALATTVVPLVTFMGTLSDLIAASPLTRAPGGTACPDTSGWCSSGTAVCTQGQTGLDFDFDECVVIEPAQGAALGGEPPLTLDGNLTAIPGSTVLLTFASLFINNQPAVSGTGSINTFQCDYTVNVTTTDDVFVNGLVTICDGQDYPTADTLGVSFSDFFVTMVFNGQAVIPASATQDGNHVADCTINLDTFTSDCHAAD